MNKFQFKIAIPALGLLFALGSLAPPSATASVSVGVSITLAPPELPVYEQPPLPAPGYLWTPGYWAWGPDGYFWVPGTWVRPPRVGFLWTPGYWGWSGGFFVWNAGYWGPHVGFYGGVNYGYGYGGSGYEGGYWRGNNWYYNRAVNRFDDRVHITNVYERNVTVVNNVTVNRVSYNGGRGGIDRRPTREEQDARRGPHLGYTPDQRAQERGAQRDRSFLATENHGRPPVMATQRPGAFAPGADRRVERTDRPPSARQRDAGRLDAPRAADPARASRATDTRGPAPRSIERRDAPARAPMRAPDARAPERRAPEQRSPQQRAPAQRGPEPRAAEQRGGERGGPPAQERRGAGERDHR